MHQWFYQEKYLVEDELIFQYRKEAKKIINKNFGPEAWNEFIESVKNNRNER